MTGFFQQAIEFFQILLDMLINGVQALVMLFTQIPKWLAFSYTLYSFLPPVLLSFAALAVSLSVIFLVIGRNG